MSTLVQLTPMLILMLISALLTALLVYFISGLIIRVRSKPLLLSQKTITLYAFVYIIFTQLFWLGISMTRLPIERGVSILFYVALFVLSAFWASKKFSTNFTDSFMIGLALVFILFIVEALSAIILTVFMILVS